VKPRIKLWLQKGKEPIAGRGRVELLLTIEKEGSLNRAAKKLRMSYRHAWGIIHELERKLGFKIVRSDRGGEQGGGTQLTERGRALTREYKLMSDALNEIVKEKTFWEVVSTKLSARNRLKGVVREVQLGEVGAKVKIEVEPAIVTSFITKEAAEALRLKKGDRVEAVIKATEVMVAKS